MAIVIIVPAKMDFTAPLYSSLSGGKESIVKMCCCGGVCGWLMHLSGRLEESLPVPSGFHSLFPGDKESKVQQNICEKN